jgi:hypothetical protein
MITIHDLREASAEQTYDWIEHIAENLRPEDLAELEATAEDGLTSDLDPTVRLFASVMLSEMGWIVCADGEPVCILGGAPTPSEDEGVVWMMGTPGMDRRGVKIAIGRRTPAHLDILHKRWRRLFNHVDARNHVSLVWLRRSGFVVEDVDMHHGREERPFYLFSSTREGPTHL